MMIAFSIIIIPLSAQFRQAADGGDMAAGLGNAGHCVRKRFAGDLHVIGVGVQQCGGIPHHAHMAFPENQIATAKCAQVNGKRIAQFHLLPGVARTFKPRALHGGLQQAGTIQTQAIPATHK